MVQSVMAIVDLRYDDRDHLALHFGQVGSPVHQRLVELKMSFEAWRVVAVDAKNVVDVTFWVAVPVEQLA